MGVHLLLASPLPTEPPALREEPNRLFQVLDLCWRSPESGDLWCTSRQLKKVDPPCLWGLVEGSLKLRSPTTRDCWDPYLKTRALYKSPTDPQVAKRSAKRSAS